MKVFSSQNSVFRILSIVVLGIAMTSCGLFNNNPEYKLSDLQGLWQENNTEEYVRFTTEQAEEAGYFLGLEWNLAEDVTEQDRLDERAADGFPGNGWFQYKFETNEKQLTEIHFMTNGGAEIPKIYIVSKLTATELVYYNKEYTNEKHYFTRK